MDLDKSRVIAILGDIDTCKTNLAIYLLRSYQGKRKVYLLGYPRQVDNFQSLTNFNDLFKISDGIVFIDEIQRFIRSYEHHKNTALQELISFFAHNNLTLIMTTQLSQFITKGTEAFVDTWCMTRIGDIQCLKNGSKPKRIIQTTVHPKCTSWALSLSNGEYLEHCDSNLIGENGIKTFPDQGIKKDWRQDFIFKKSQENGVVKSQQISQKSLQKSPTEFSLQTSEVGISSAPNDHFTSKNERKTSNSS
jgi:hypothetical protein